MSLEKESPDSETMGMEGVPARPEETELEDRVLASRFLRGRESGDEREMEAAFRMLTVRYQERVHKLVYGYTVDEVAEMMHERPETVRYLVRKGRTKLRRLVLKDPAFGEPVEKMT